MHVYEWKLVSGWQVSVCLFELGRVISERPVSFYRDADQVRLVRYAYIYFDLGMFASFSVPSLVCK